MCLTCGCGETAGAGGVSITALGPPHAHAHDESRYDHPHDHPALDTLVLEERVLARNDHLAEHLRAWLAVRRIDAINLMSSPGSGKTSLLERTVVHFAAGREVCVVEGDQETTFDADRIARAGARAVQINTGSGCHLDADMVQRALHALQPTEGSLVFVENVGNLVCPALFDIGERAKVVVISVTEGDDKPLKYPHMFATADVVVVNKTDLLPYVDFDVDRLTEQARSLNPGVSVLPLSVKTGDGSDHWYAWLDRLGSTHETSREGAVHGAAVRP